MLWLENLESRVLLSAGVLDTRFGTGGQITTPETDNNELIASQNGGRFVVAGQTQETGLAPQGFLERFRSNGTPDRSFGGDGQANLDATQFANILSIASAPQGKLVVIGQDANGNDFLARFTSRGALDAHFGSGGMVALPAGAISPQARVEGYGSVVVAADFSNSGASPTGELLHYTHNGVFDTHFGVDGVAGTAAGVGYVCGDFQLLAGGQIEALFYSSSPGGETALERFNANGILELGFDQNQGGIIPAANANRFLPSGYILSIGNTTSGLATVSDYTPAGLPYIRFGNQGSRSLQFPANDGNAADRAIVETGYKLLLIQTGTTATTPYLAFGGLSATGKIDRRFGISGVVQETPTNDLIAAAGDGALVILLESTGGVTPVQTIVAYKI